MFNEKKLHYLIVAALAASFSSDATAATRSDDDASEFTTPSRASSRGFAACESTDTVCWNQLRQEERSCEISATSQSGVSELFQEVVPTEISATRQPEEIDLGDGRRLTLDSIRYQDDYFATTLDAVHSSRPISLRLDEIVRNPDLFDTFDASQRLAYVTNANQQHLWTYVGRVVKDGRQEPEFIEGSLPLKVEIQRTPDAGMELSIAVDGEELARQLM